jgi:sirohydrochlorin ferrochelatase
MSEKTLGTAHMTDDEFIAAFERREIAATHFHHADHVRLAWLYVERLGAREAEVRVLTGIRALAEHLGVPDKFNYTQTAAWVRVIASTRACHMNRESFGEWLQVHPAFLDQDHLLEYYSKDLLEGALARSQWTSPDLKPLP